MCKMNVVIGKLMLGNRLLGYECWNGKEVMEYTEKQLKDIILAGKQKVCGLRISENGELELDMEGFYTSNLSVHTHIGNWTTLGEDSKTNLLYTCIGSKQKDGKTVYDCISNRFEQLEVEEQDMMVYLKIGIVASGAKLDGDKILVASTGFSEITTATKPAGDVVEEKKTAEEKKAAVPVVSTATKGKTEAAKK